MIARALAVAACAGAFTFTVSAAADTPGFRLTSPAFKPGGAIPVVYTCKGKSRSPGLWARSTRVTPR